MTALRRFAPLAAVALLLVVAGVAASLSSTKVTRLPLPGQQGPAQSISPSARATAPERTVAPTARPPAPPNSAADRVFIAIVVLAVLAVITTIVLVFWFLRGDARRVYRRVPDPEPVRSSGQGREEVLAALDAGLSDLADGDPRRAVIACWVRLEHAAAAAGTPRHVGDAPGELVTRLLAEHQVSSALLGQLAALYRVARYATHTVDAGMRARAQAALTELRAELTASVRAAHPAPVGVAPPAGGPDGYGVRPPAPRAGGPANRGPA